MIRACYAEQVWLSRTKVIFNWTWVVSQQPKSRLCSQGLASASSTHAVHPPQCHAAYSSACSCRSEAKLLGAPK